MRASHFPLRASKYPLPLAGSKCRSGQSILSSWLCVRYLLFHCWNFETQRQLWWVHCSLDLNARIDIDCFCPKSHKSDPFVVFGLSGRPFPIRYLHILWGAWLNAGEYHSGEFVSERIIKQTSFLPITLLVHRFLKLRLRYVKTQDCLAPCHGANCFGAGEAGS